MPNIKQINNQFKEGYIPIEFINTIYKKDIDIDKITYNDTYKSFDYHAKNFHFINLYQV